MLIFELKGFLLIVQINYYDGILKQYLDTYKDFQEAITSEYRLGRRKSIITFDCLLLLGLVIMVGTTSLAILIVGGVFVGLNVGMTFMASPLYISEVSPTRVCGNLVGLNSFLVTGGHFSKFYKESMTLCIFVLLHQFFM